MSSVTEVWLQISNQVSWPLLNIFHIDNVKIAALKKRGTHDIIRPAWIFDCIKEEEVLPLESKYECHSLLKIIFPCEKIANLILKILPVLDWKD
jgi:hypothetical protein